MNVALGFDTFLAMRHGVPPAVGEPAPPPASVKAGEPYTGRLGCYYCNDIVAPMDVSDTCARLTYGSLQMLTCLHRTVVDRPHAGSNVHRDEAGHCIDRKLDSGRADGVRITASQGVGLNYYVRRPATPTRHQPDTVLAIPHSSLAPSDIPLSSPATATTSGPPPTPESKGSPLGLVPHQIRGFLAQFHNLKITGQAYDLCTGCSPTVVGAYERDGWAMLSQAFEDASFLERLTGLDKLAEEGERAMEAMMEGSESGEDDF